jgi:hypothetical protein
VRQLKKATGLSFPGFGFGVPTKAVRAEACVCWPAGWVGLVTCSSLFEKIPKQCTVSSDEACRFHSAYCNFIAMQKPDELQHA